MCPTAARAALVVFALVCCHASVGVNAAVDADLFPVPETNAVTFWGHACFYIDIDGYGIVTDPVFETYVFLRWRHLPVPPASSYAATRLILISHAHPDHLSLDTLRDLPSDATILCPTPSERYISTLGREVRAMTPGEEFEFPGGKVVAVAAQHAGTRYGVRSQADGGALGFVIETPYGTVYFSGDTNLFRGMEDVGKTHAPDVSILSISGHLHGGDAVEAARLIGSDVVIPGHFGAYGYLFMPAPKRPRDYEELEEALGDAVVLLAPGEAYSLLGGDP